MSKHSVKVNFVYNSAYQIINILAPLVTIPYLSRVLGASGVGEYSYTYSIANWFVLLGLLGLSRYGSREIALVQSDKTALSRTFAALYCIQLSATLIACVAYSFIVFFSDEIHRVYLLIWLIWVASNLFDVSWFFFGIEDFKLTATRSSLVKIVTIACIFLFVKSNDDIALYCFITALGNLLSALILWPFLFRHIKLQMPEFAIVKSRIFPCLRLFLPVVATSLYTIIDKVILGYMAPPQELGYFEYAEKLSKVPLAFILALGTVMLPRISNALVSGEKSRADAYLDRSISVSLILALAFAFGIAAIAPEFVPIFFGEQFIPATPMMIALSVAIPIIAWSNVVGVQYLLPTRKDNGFTVAVCMGALANLILNFTLIPLFAGMGAVIATIGAETAVLITQLFFINDWRFIRSGLKTLVPFLVFGVIMYYLIRILAGYVSGGIVGLGLEIGFGIVVYMAFTLAYGFIQKRISGLK